MVSREKTERKAVKKDRPTALQANRMCLLAWCISCYISLPVALGAIDETSRSAWRVSGGLIHRSIRKIAADAPTQLGTEDVPGASSEMRGTQEKVGDPGKLANRNYDNGFVYQDAASGADGSTWYWGYNNTAQVVGDELHFRAQVGTEVGVNRQADTVRFQDNDTNKNGVGAMVQAERLWYRSKKTGFGILLQASYVHLSSSLRGSTFSDAQTVTTYSRTIHDTYKLHGVTPPAAPYSGTFEGPGPIINNIPDSRSVERQRISSGTYEAYNQINSRLEIDLTTISIGAVMEGQIGRLRTALSTGPSLNIIAMDTSHHEVLWGSSAGAPASQLAAWYDTNDQTKVEPGVFAQLVLGYAITDQLSVDLFGRVDHVARVTGNVGPAQYKANLDGHSLGLVLTWRFATHP